MSKRPLQGPRLTPRARGVRKIASIVSRSGLRVEIIAFMILLMSFLLLTLGTAWLRLAERNFIQMKYNVADSILANLQSMIQLEWEGRSVLVLGVSDRSRLLDILQAFANNVRLEGVFIVGPERKILTHQRPDLIGQPYSDEDMEAAFSKLTVVRRFLSATGKGGLHEKDEVQITGPLFLGNQTVGVARFSLPMKDVVASMRATRGILLLYLIFTAVLTTLIGSVVLMRLVIRPLAELEQATLRIMEGRLDHKVPIRSENEIGRLALALAQLHRTLLERNRKLADQKDNLSLTAEKLLKAEAEVIRQDRLAYVGRVAAGVAHEIGNPLGAVFNYIGVLRSLPPLGAGLGSAQSDEILTRVQHEVERIDRIVRELLDFSRQSQPSSEVLNIPAFVERCVGILKDQRQLDGIETRIASGPEIPELELDPGQLKQVIFNILTNSKDAMGENGRIEIEIEKIAFSESDIIESRMADVDEPEGAAFTDLARRGIVFSSRPPFVRGETLVAVHVRDSGPGLSDESVQHVFEPFFTTKTPGKGTGLGLAICQRIVENFGGVLRFESRRSKKDGKAGAVLSIYLPLARPPAGERTREELLAALGEA